MSNFGLNFTQRWKFSTLRGMEELNYLDWEGARGREESERPEGGHSK